jgi:hypothetical protein
MPTVSGYISDHEWVSLAKIAVDNKMNYGKLCVRCGIWLVLRHPEMINEAISGDLTATQ